MPNLRLSIPCAVAAALALASCNRNTTVLAHCEVTSSGTMSLCVDHYGNIASAQRVCEDQTVQAKKWVPGAACDRSAAVVGCRRKNGGDVTWYYVTKGDTAASRRDYAKSLCTNGDQLVETDWQPGK